MRVKVHMGCGAVYLAGYINVDLPSPRTFLSHQRPDLVSKYITEEGDYYGRHTDKTVDTLRAGPLEQEYVCDRYGSFFFLPISNDERIVEVLARHSFEHLSITEARMALSTLYRATAPGAILRIDVPDHVETLKKYQETGDSFYERHLFGPQRGDYGYHMMSYTPQRLISLVESHGFEFGEREPNIHALYPAFCCRFRRRS